MTLTPTQAEGFVEYHKIETLFERNKETFIVDHTKLKSPVLGTISQWDVTEKIDGTNIRIILSPAGEVTFGGRTNNAMIPAHLVQYLMKTFDAEKLQRALWIEGESVEIILFGEGYGPGIQKGGDYRQDKSFILFDVLVSGKWWLDRISINYIAEKLGIDTVPYLGRMTLDQIVDLCQTPFKSKLGTAISEGVVARPIETLFDKKGKRIIIKLKTKDFAAGKR